MAKLVASIFIENDKKQFLMGIRKSDGNYCTPGGKIENGEKVKDGAIREVYEETDVVILPKNLKFIGYVELDEKLIMFFWTKVWHGEVKNTEPDKCEEWEWIKWNSWPTNIVPGLQLFQESLIPGLYSTRMMYGKTI